MAEQLICNHQVVGSTPITSSSRNIFGRIMNQEVFIMNKTELIEAVQAKVKPGDFPSKAASYRIIDATLDAIKEAVNAGDSVSLVGFGTFKAADRAPREARNPQTGEAVMIPARRVPTFKAGAGFKSLVAGE